ncbi:ribonuclease P protein component [Anaplasmataceae bacterium AB001_6]|nr:ribonuclease P protein component [Anaplasmataceae bacterium AB001_6]
MLIKGFASIPARTLSVIKKKSRAYHSDFFVCLALNSSGNKPSFACIASKRVGRATMRNYTKRLLRSMAVRNVGLFLNNCSYVFVAKSAMLDCEFSVLEESLIKTLNLIRKRNSCSANNINVIARRSKNIKTARKKIIVC